MSSQYRTAAKPSPAPRDREAERFIRDLEAARTEDELEHTRRMFAFVAAAFVGGWWLVRAGSLLLLAGPAIFGIGLVPLSVSLWPATLLPFHIAYRLMGGRRIPWPPERALVERGREVLESLRAA